MAAFVVNYDWFFLSNKLLAQQSIQSNGGII